MKKNLKGNKHLWLDVLGYTIECPSVDVLQCVINNLLTVYAHVQIIHRWV